MMLEPWPRRTALKADTLPSVSELDTIVEKSLRSFYRAICSEWCGRENEAVSLYAFGHLAKEVRKHPGRLLYDPTQIGIEVAVRQLRRKKFKGQVRTVRKDLVIWPTPGMTLWKANALHNGVRVMEVHNEPLAVMEWKVNHYLSRAAHRKNQREHRGDTRWLCVTSRRQDMGTSRKLAKD